MTTKGPRKYSMENRGPVDAEAVRRADRERKADQRAAGREIIIPDVVNPQRRERCQADPERFLRTYMPVKFKNPFCRHHIAMIDALEECLHYSGWQAMAAPRGDGKSSIAEGMIIRAINYGLRHFPLLIGATESDAQNRKQAIGEVYEQGELLMEDFPEICWPIRELGKSGRKGNQQAIDGVFTNIQWPSGVKAREMRFPTVPGSLASGAWLVIRGMEKGNVRGMKMGNDRPDLVVLDDVESQQSTRSDYLTGAIETKIDREVTPLAGPNTGIAIFMPCTIINVGCIADKFTDPQKHPENAAWMGQRHALIIEWPECHGAEGEADLWAVYRRQCGLDAMEGDRTSRAAHKMYLDNREAMDAGCVVSNEYRYVSTKCKDGSELESSTVEGIMRFIARKGDNERAWAIMRAEYQNQPDESNAPEGSDCTEETVKKAINGVPRGLCPPGTTFLTAGMDIHKQRIFWTIVAWVGSHAHIVDYDALDTHGPKKSMRGDATVTEDVKRAIFNTLSEWSETESEGRPVQNTGEVKYLDRVLIDSRFLPDPIYDFTSKMPGKTYHPVTGSGGKMRDSYRPPRKNTKESQIGRWHYYAVRQNDRGGTWLLHADSDYWVEHVQNGCVLTVSMGDNWTLQTRDAVAFFGSDKLRHRDIASHIMAEEFVTQFVPGRGLESRRVVRHSGNHWLDCLVYAFTAAALAGVKFGHMPAETKKRPTGRSRAAGTAKIHG